MECVYFMYNFESKFFCFHFFEFLFESKENHFVLMQFHVFIWRISWFQFVKRFRQRKTKRLRPDEICTQLFIQKKHQKVHPFFISLSNVKHIFCIHSYILTSFYTDSNAINAINAVELPSNWHLKRNLSRWNSKRSMSSPVVHCDHCPLPRPQPSYCLAPVKFVQTNGSPTDCC